MFGVAVTVSAGLALLLPQTSPALGAATSSLLLAAMPIQHGKLGFAASSGSTRVGGFGAQQSARSKLAKTNIRGWPTGSLVVSNRGKLKRNVKVSTSTGRGAGRIVVVQRKERGEWRTRATGRTSSTGHYRVQLRTRHKPVHYRVKVRATGQSASARSQPLSLVGLGKLGRAKQAQLITKINAVRATGTTCGGTRYRAAKPLQPKRALIRAAQKHATDMGKRNFFSHGGGTTPWSRAARMGFRGALAENIAAGRATVKATVRAWVNSPAHCRNLMSRRYNKIGVGHDYVRSSRWGHYWVMVVGR
ncbi:MAG: CAP domain-containing protein [Actinomycetia bacterium]|nr:CAP domain-containing protein [Actinomycetes bacterium]